MGRRARARRRRLSRLQLTLSFRGSGGLPLSAITAQEADRYKGAKAHEQGGLSAEPINKTIILLAQIMDVAVLHELVERNPATGKNRRLRTAKPARTFIDSADGIEALLASAELDAEGRATPHRRALLATLLFAGLRIDEGSRFAGGM